MKRLLLIFLATWIVGCETSIVGCFGHWVTGPGPQRGTRELNRDAHLPSVSYTHLTLPTKA